MNNAEAVGDIIDYLNRGDFNSGEHRSSERHHDRPFYIADNSIHADYAGFQLSSQFQPIVLLKNGWQAKYSSNQSSSDSQHSGSAANTVAYEALLAVRSARGLLPFGDALSPQNIFSLPDRSGEITLLDRLTRTLHALNFLIQDVLIQDVPAQLHLNVHTDHLLAVNANHGHVFEQILRQCGLDPSAIVLEISEYCIRDKTRLRSAIANWRSRGYRIAADNFGRGHTQLARVLDLPIDILKIDRSLLLAAQHSRRGADLLLRIAAACAERNVTTIATAVETTAQQQLVEQSGIDNAQGFLFARPSPHCQTMPELAAADLRANC